MSFNADRLIESFDSARHFRRRFPYHIGWECIQIGRELRRRGFVWSAGRWVLAESCCASPDRPVIPVKHEDQR